MNNYVLNYKHCLNQYVHLHKEITTLQIDYNRRIEEANAYYLNIRDLIDYLSFFSGLRALAKKEIELILNAQKNSYNTQLDCNSQETVHSLSSILKYSETIKKHLEELIQLYPSVFTSAEYLHTESTLNELLQRVSIKSLKESDETILNISICLEIAKKDLIPLYSEVSLNEYEGVKKHLLETINTCLYQYRKPNIDTIKLKEILNNIIKEHKHFTTLENNTVSNDIKDIVKVKYKPLLNLNKSSLGADDLLEVYNMYKHNNEWLHHVITEYGDLISCQALTKYTLIKKEIVAEINSLYDNPKLVSKLKKLNLLKIINDAEREYQDFIDNFGSLSDEEVKRLGNNYQKLKLLKNIDFTIIEIGTLREFITVLRHNNVELVNIRKEVSFMKSYLEEKDLDISNVPIAKGGEGLIYQLNDSPVLCYKKYHNHIEINDKKDKLAYMHRYQYDNFQGEYYSICWPDNLVFNNKQFTGFVMKLAHPEALTLYELIQPTLSDKLRLKKEWSSRYSRDNYNGFLNRVKLCANLALAIHHIHEKGNAVIVDLKPQNVLFQSNGYIYITDCDSFQIKTDDGFIYRAKVATPEYAPPESGIAPDTKLDIDQNWDNFSLAVIIYEVLFGIHPYVANYGGIYDEHNTVRQRIANNLFVHNVEKKYINHIPDQHTLYQLLPRELMRLFNNAFTSVNRPTPKDWRIALGAFTNEEANKNIIDNIVLRTNEINDKKNISVKMSKRVPSAPIQKNQNILVTSDRGDGTKVLYVFMIILIFVLIIAALATR